MILGTRLNELLSRWEASGGSATPESLCEDSPELLPHLRECIAKLNSTDAQLKPSDSLHTPQIDGYGIQRLVGRGGMGSVWLATQNSTRRSVALKVIGAGEFASPRARSRFEREIELASRLTHPGIARVYDSGLNGAKYYFAMEHIEGKPLDVFVRDGELSRGAIVDLMIGIGHAVGYAHRMGILHRDLKPTNILVRVDGSPSLLDFGLAKEIGPTDAAVITLDDAPGTPAFMSPEQASGDHTKVGVASDLYSLGVILFRLLTGSFPHEVTGSVVDVMRRIASVDPARPRTIVPTMERDLECIVMKCLERDPQRRYINVDTFVDDLAAFRSGRAVKAASLGKWYTIQKFVRRHRIRLAVAGMVAVVILSILAGAFAKVRNERDVANTNAAVAVAANEFLTRMLSAADPSVAQGHIPTVPELLERASSEVEKGAASNPLVEASIRQTIGKTFLATQRYEDAGRHLLRAVEIRTGRQGADNAQTLDAVADVCLYHITLGQYQIAEKTAKDALAISRQSIGEDHAVTVRLATYQLSTLYYQRRFDAYRVAAEEQLARTERAYGKDSLKVADVKGGLALVLLSEGRFAEAESLLSVRAEMIKRERGERYPPYVLSLANLSMAKAGAGKLDEAIAVAEKGVELRELVYGQKHDATAYGWVKLAELYERRGEAQRAKTLFLQAESLYRELYGFTRSQAIEVLYALFRFSDAAERAELRSYFPLIRPEAERKLEGDQELDLTWIEAWIEVLRQHGEFDEARSYSERVSASWLSRVDSTDPRFDRLRQLGSHIVLDSTTKPTSQNP
jgi:tetratricopeptide (TPR) repeat protein